MPNALAIFDSNKLPTPVPAVWISIAEAVARSGIPERTLRRHCQRRWRAMGLARIDAAGDWRIDPTADDRFAAPASQNADAELLDLRQVSATKRTMAARKREVVSDLTGYIARRVSEVGRTTAIAEFAAKYGGSGEQGTGLPYGVKFSARTLYSWLDAAKHAPVSGLVDKRGLVGDRQEPDPDVIGAFVQIWLTDPNRGSLKSAYKKLCYLCDQGHKWFFGSYRTFCRWVKDTYPQAMITLNREGEQAYRKLHEPCRDQDQKHDQQQTGRRRREVGEAGTRQDTGCGHRIIMAGQR